jgi:hypothetical protein
MPPPRGIIYYKSVQVLAYADDLDIGRSERDVKEAFIKLNNEAQKMCLNVNEEKTKYMEITAKPTKNKYLNVGNYRFQKVTEFKYLGTMISYDNNLDIENHHRLLLANRCHHGLKKQIKSHYISIKTKCKLYKTLIRPVLLHVCETWAINRYNEEKIANL